MGCFPFKETFPRQPDSSYLLCNGERISSTRIREFDFTGEAGSGLAVAGVGVVMR